MSADAVIDIPEGVWNYYVQHPSGYVSAYPDIFIATGKSEHYKQIDAPLRKAGTLDFSRIVDRLPPDEHVAVYISNVTQPANLATIRPIPLGTTRVFVPAEEAVVPLVISKGSLLHVGEIHRVHADAVENAHPFTSPVKGTGDVVSWIKINYDILEHTPDTSKLTVPEVELRVDGKLLNAKPYLPLRAGAANELSLVIFKAVPFGRTDVTLHGETWEADEVHASFTGEVRVTDSPLVATPAASVTVTWSIPADWRSLASNMRKCNDDETTRDEPSTARLYLLSCPGVTPSTTTENIQPSNCTVKFLADLPEGMTSGSHVFQGVPTGTYVAGIRADPLPWVLKTAFLDPGEFIAIDLASAFGTVFGRVTRSGEPIQAEVAFSAGTALSNASTGIYSATVAESPGGDFVTVRPCNSKDSITLAPEHPILLNSEYNIELPATLVSTLVRDADTGNAIAGASTRATVFFEENTVLYGQSGSLTDADGRSDFTSLPTAMDVTICAQKEGFSAGCSERFTLTSDSEHRTATILLRHVQSHSGKVLAPIPLRAAMLTWVDSLGQPIEAVGVDADGTFSYEKAHTQNEVIIFVSANMPLQLFRSAGETEQPLQLQLSLAPLRTFSIEVASRPGETALVGMTIDGIRIPSDLLDRHQSYRGLPSMILNGAPMLVRDIVTGGSIEVTLGPAPGIIPQELTTSDWFLIPQYANAFPRLSLGTATRLSF